MNIYVFNNIVKYISKWIYAIGSNLRNVVSRDIIGLEPITVVRDHHIFLIVTSPNYLA